jgi:hypothetical protein
VKNASTKRMNANLKNCTMNVFAPQQITTHLGSLL